MWKILALVLLTSPAWAAPTPIAVPSAKQNPTFVEGAIPGGPIKRSKLTGGKCIGFVTEAPTHTLKIPAGAKGRIAIEADGLGLWVMNEAKAHWCKTRTVIDLPKVAGQTLKIWLVTALDDPKKPYRVTVEDLSIPRSAAWTDTTPVLTLGPDAKPLVGTGRAVDEGKFGGRALWKIPNCFTKRVQSEPIAVLDVKAPVKDVKIRLAASADFRNGEAVLVGPYPAERGKERAWCLRSRRGISLKPGRYAVHLRKGFPKSGLVSVQFGEGEVSEIALSPGVGTLTKTIEERALGLLIPTFSGNSAKDKFRRAWRTRFDLFEGVPPQVYVYPKADLTAAKYAVDGPKGKDTQLPKKDEPLLLISPNGLVLTADGLLFHVKRDKLALTPSGAAALPAAARPWAMEEPGRLADGPEAEKISAPYFKALEKDRKCSIAIWEKITPDKIIKSDDGSFEVKVTDKRAEARANRLIEKKCRFGLEKKKKARDKKLRALLAKQRAERYGALKAKIAGRLK